MRALKKSSFVIGSLSLIGASSIVFTSCSHTLSLNEKLTNVVPDGTVYENIFATEFSFLFQNSGGKSFDGQNKNPYNTYGTGWLFDYELDNNKNPEKWVGYFGTNLHVADSLLNPKEENDKYRPSYLSATGSNDGLDKTIGFYLGKFDNFSKSALSSVKVNENDIESDMTYVPLSNIPTTQYAAIDFYRGGNPVDDPSANDKTYVDFAVLKITLDLKNENEKLVHEKWIKRSIESIDQTSKPKRNLSAFDNWRPETRDESMFWREEWSNVYLDSQQQMLKKYRAFIGGYPYVSTNRAPKFIKDTTDSDPSQNLKHGSPRWTINVDEKSANPAEQNGQKFDYQNISPSYGFYGSFKHVYGAYLAEDKYYDFTYTYHGQKYRQTGWGFIVHDSNLSGGSSGSMLMNQDKQIMGIYFGTFMRRNEETNFGLVQSLIMTESFAREATLASKLKVKPYDLIAGDQNTNYSYKTSLNKTKTFLFDSPQEENVPNEEVKP